MEVELSSRAMLLAFGVAAAMGIFFGFILRGAPQASTVERYVTNNQKTACQEPL